MKTGRLSFNEISKTTEWSSERTFNLSSEKHTKENFREHGFRSV